MPHDQSSPPLTPRPRSAVPSHLLNGGSPLHHSPGSARAKERETLASSIKSTYGRRAAVEFGDSQNAATTSAGTSWRGLEDDVNIDSTTTSKPHGPARDNRDEAPPTPTTISRPASPYTLNPPIDFDGLSWPCIVPSPLSRVTS